MNDVHCHLCIQLVEELHFKRNSVMHIKSQPFFFVSKPYQSPDCYPNRLDSRSSQVDVLKVFYLEQLVSDLRKDNQQLFDQMEEMRVKNFEKENEYINQLKDLQEQILDVQALNKNYEYQVQFLQMKISYLEQNHRPQDLQLTNSTDLFNSKLQSESEESNQQIRSLNNILEQKNIIIKEYDEMRNKFKLTQIEWSTKIEQLNIEIRNLNKQITKLELQLINQQKQVSLYQNESQLWRSKFLQLNKNYNKSSEKLVLTNVELDTAKKEIQQINELRNKRRSVGSIV
ncbi:unnamed protein product (macronuclear) [Paramecium tetraurelia]|uniref:Uncharacterized protein n=1 Tax=Paramecium tetraurelia TaxID=5888 RepID=A0BVP6_PARTE|nr:uncharacterized protein GSPATT00032465001 [Paramecium tetraurelia]CAK62613.1 unnamed protein product [Paramecium tetraurelia]|eukprot:XP_001430011.1 hypothetical protein (macronuclear) [Paramecium tetraurelia strain d4-2]